MAPALKIMNISKIPQNKEEAEKALASLGDLQRQIALEELAYKESAAKLKEAYGSAVAPIRLQMETQFSCLSGYAQTHRVDICDGDKKSAVFENGTMRWYNRPPRVNVQSAAKAIASAKEHNWPQFVRTKEELDKDAMLANTEDAEQVAGVKIKSAGEVFAVKPHQPEEAGIKKQEIVGELS